MVYSAHSSEITGIEAWLDMGQQHGTDMFGQPALPGVSFSQWLKRQRTSKGLTQEQLAHQIGCAAITLRKIEADQRRPSVQVAERLAEILHVPAGERTAFLRYARGELRYALGDLPDESPWQSGAARRTNLPADVTAIIGREAQVEAIRGQLLRDDVRLVTLIGPPGIGKTRLSTEVARGTLGVFIDGVFFIGLAPLDDASKLANTVLHCLDFAEDRRLSVQEQLKTGIAARRMLLVLDNCEHLVQDAAHLSLELLRACPNLKILATSRGALRIPGEWLHTVPPLSLPEDGVLISADSVQHYSALMLFAERARAVQSDFGITDENVGAVASICARLDGLPLAIELTAAQTRVLSTAALLERLGGVGFPSASAARLAIPSQLSLDQAIGRSFDLLTAPERKLFAYFSVFSGGFSLEAAEAAFTRDFRNGSVLQILTSLLDRSLLQRSRDVLGEARFSMLVTIQHFARERLRESGDEVRIRDSHLGVFLALAERLDREIHGFAGIIRGGDIGHGVALVEGGRAAGRG